MLASPGVDVDEDRVDNLYSTCQINALEQLDVYLAVCKIRFPTC